MKKVVLLIGTITFALQSFGQITFQPLGDAGNALTAYRANSHLVATDNALGTAVFIHRNNQNVYPGTNIGHYRYDISTNKGGTWLLNNGILNPQCNNSTVSSRYPQAAIYNPSGNTTPSNAYMMFVGPYHINSDWDGINSGSAKLDNTPASFVDSVNQMNGGDFLIPSSFVKGAPGVYWNIATNEATADGSILVMKGTYNPANKTLGWKINTIIQPIFDHQSDNTDHMTIPNIAFDATGQNGWIACLADMTETLDPGTDFVYQPCFYKTTDGGNTWTGPIKFSFSAFPNLRNSFSLPFEFNATTADSVYAVTSAFESDLVVDNLGQPHLGCAIGFGPSMSEATTDPATNGYTIKGGFLGLFDFSWNAAQDRWYCSFIDSLKDIRADTIGVTVATPAAVSQDNRVQLCISPDASKVYYSWADYRGVPGTTAARHGRNVYLRGFDPANYKVTSNEVSVTEGVAGWNDRGYLHSGGYMGFRNAANDSTNVPVVLAKFSVNKNPEDTTHFYYVNNVNFADASFTLLTDTSSIVYVAPVSGVNSVANLSKVGVYPNPSNGKIYVNLSSLTGNNADVLVYNSVGQLVSKSTGISVALNPVLELNLTKQMAGTYFVSIISNNNIQTRQVIIK